MENFEHQNLIGIKSEFEAEGLTQLEIADYFVTNPWANLRVVKLGGCEAKTDFRAAVRLGANVLVAPMIESVFAAEKFSGMYADQRTVHRWINLETVNGRKFAREICSFASRETCTYGEAFRKGWLLHWLRETLALDGLGQTSRVQ